LIHFSDCHSGSVMFMTAAIVRTAERPLAIGPQRESSHEISTASVHHSA